MNAPKPIKKIMQSARGEYCTVRLPFVCNGNSETTVFAHIPGVRFGHGMGIKTKFGAYACSSCHDVLDGRVPRPKGLSQEFVKLAHYEGVIETLEKLSEKGLVNV